MIHTCMSCKLDKIEELGEHRKLVENRELAEVDMEFIGKEKSTQL